MTTYYATTIDSPVGPLTLVATDDGLTEIAWPATEPESARHRDAATCDASDHPVLAATSAQLREYFDGSRQEFDLPLRPEGTEFQLAVWQALRTIPYGKTISYGEQARQIDRPRAARAVGAANGRNPISIVVPCHRVIGSTGALTGFGGGIEVKAALLEHETRELMRTNQRGALADAGPDAPSQRG